MALISVSPDEPNRQWTYRDLLEDAERAAHWLLERFEPGDHITVWSPNLAEWVVLQHGAAMAGLVLVTANPSLRGAELKYVLEQSGSVGIAFADEFRGTDMRALLTDVLSDVPPAVREHIAFADWLEQVRAIDIHSRSLPQVAPDSPAQLQYTSGTTGFPKGAKLSHRAMVTNASYVQRRALSSDGVIAVSAMPLFHTAGSGLACLGTLTQRGTLVLCVVFDPELVLRSIQDWGGPAATSVSRPCCAPSSIIPASTTTTCRASRSCNPAATPSHLDWSTSANPDSSSSSPPSTVRPS